MVVWLCCGVSILIASALIMYKSDAIMTKQNEELSNIETTFYLKTSSATSLATHKLYVYYVHACSYVAS